MTKPHLIITNHNPFNLQGFGQVDPLPTLSKALSVLNQTGLPHYLSAGTALGIVRDNGFIPHDTDIDIAIPLSWDEDQYELTKELVKIFAHNNLLLVRSILTGQKPVQLVFSDLLNHQVLVDVEFYYAGLVPEKLVHTKPEGTITTSPYNVAHRAFEGFSVPLPDPIDDYLTERYGDWRTPYGKKGDWKDYTQVFTPWQD